MSPAKISFAESALSDLEEIQEWYRDEGVPEVGDRFVAEIFERVETLVEHPDIGRIVPEFGQPFLRELIHPPSGIVYRREAQRGPYRSGLAQRTDAAVAAIGDIEKVAMGNPSMAAVERPSQRLHV